jgi:hypothetical protein
VKINAHTLILEWRHWQAASVDEMARKSFGEVGCIEMMRLEPMGRESMTVVVSLPPAIFAAAMARYRDRARSNRLADCVFDAIYAAHAAEREHFR